MSAKTKARVLNCPAYVVASKPKYKGGHVELVKDAEVSMCQSVFEYNPDELDADLKAQGDLLLHLRENHNFYWMRHGKKLVTRFSKQYAMRNK